MTTHRERFDAGSPDPTHPATEWGGELSDAADIPRAVFETAQGVWTGDAPAGRADYEDTVEFVGVSDPAGPDGVATPGNLVMGDRWRQMTEYVA
jgi:hypothetical protein